MKKRRKVFLPKWQRWYLIPVMLGIWVLITYLEFFKPDNPEKMGLVGYVILSAIFLGMSIMFWFMTSGKLPAYFIEEESEE